VRAKIEGPSPGWKSGRASSWCTGGYIFAAHHAFEHLFDQGVDGIYWFADFADKVDPELAKDLGGQMRRKGIQLTAHNFLGRPVAPEVVAMVEATGGTAISKVP